MHDKVVFFVGMMVGYFACFGYVLYLNYQKDKKNGTLLPPSAGEDDAPDKE